MNPALVLREMLGGVQAAAGGVVIAVNRDLKKLTVMSNGATVEAAYDGSPVAVGTRVAVQSGKIVALLGKAETYQV